MVADIISWMDYYRDARLVVEAIDIVLGVVVFALVVKLHLRFKSWQNQSNQIDRELVDQMRHISDDQRKLKDELDKGASN